VPEPRLDPKEWGYYWALAQVGFEMVVPIVGGMLLDNYFGWAPWGVAIGAVVGLGGGLFHLVVLMKHYEKGDSSGRERDAR
jgi:F0F1-type ATP synthase assembly protein I